MPDARRTSLIVLLGAVAAGFAPSSIQFLFMAALVLGLTIACLKESNHA
ncbi:Protein of unknown function [Propionibacterium freudenreichii]|uniref:Uncharacterized protein n=1 Tax=Propionibacterium freudenreichii TaxID=1744 RepID=A0A2C8BN75_9ACTN|nr:Protein of unknown function [Propionibacterium freudenreichii]SCQ72882.1 Hypothetical protein PFR_JS17-1_2082 [Propionibacterium freudenreichii]SCQ79680.1 Hypothetical protein PFR_JS23_1455 [Propionibacterium freudenreichii]SCQ81374.1 Hypothetical protein PFR_JS17-2_2081 [Propionibacterium freudenreichii]SCQ83281.1 Hypothetical protein PFR_JS23-PH_61 [Propionibacterium freudenreichii]